MTQPDWKDVMEPAFEVQDLLFINEMMIEQAVRLLGDRGEQPESRHFAGINFEKQRAWFNHFYSCGEKWLSGKGEGHCFARAPWTPVTSWGTVGPEGWVPGFMAMPRDYQCPTAIMMQLAGYNLRD